MVRLKCRAPIFEKEILVTLQLSFLCLSMLEKRESERGRQRGPKKVFPKIRDILFSFSKVSHLQVKLIVVS